MSVVENGKDAEYGTKIVLSTPFPSGRKSSHHVRHRRERYSPPGVADPGPNKWASNGQIGVGSGFEQQFSPQTSCDADASGEINDSSKALWVYVSTQEF